MKRWVSAVLYSWNEPFLVRPLTRRRPMARVCSRIVVAVVAVLVVVPAAATTLVDAIDQGIRQKNWTQVERASLRWALDIGPSAAAVQAAATAGMVDEALAAARLAQPWQRPRLLMAAATASDLPALRKREIIKAAFDAARADAIRPELRAAELADVAMAFFELGEEADARRSFDAALAHAKLSSPEGGYGLLVGALLLPGGGVKWPIWMLDAVAAQASGAPARDKVQVHQALATGYFRLGEGGKARAHLELGFGSARELGEPRARRLAIQALARVALAHDDIDIARRHGEWGELGAELAAFHARRNEPAKALAEVAKLGTGNMYASPRAAAALVVIRGAIDRQSVAAAVSYCNALCPFIGQEEIRIRTRIGQLQARSAQPDSARSSFLRAKELFLFEPFVGAREVQATLDLALATKAAGMHALAKETALAAVRQTLYVSLARRRAERPLAEARASEVLSELGDRDMATDLLVRAWSSTQALPAGPLRDEPTKVEALLGIARAARALKPGPTAAAPPPSRLRRH